MKGNLKIDINSKNSPRKYLNLAENMSNDTNANVSLLVPLTAKFAQSLRLGQNGISEHKDILASTQVSLKDMSRAVPPYYHQYTINVMVRLPPPVNSNRNGSRKRVDNIEENACINIEGPLSLMKDLNSSFQLPKECSIIPQYKLPSDSPQELLAHTGDHLPPSWCNQNGSIPIAFEYLEDQPLWTVYIDPQDKQIINLHLMATSVFLFAMVGIIILVIFVKSSFSRKSNFSHRLSREVNNSEVPLTLDNAS